MKKSILIISLVSISTIFSSAAQKRQIADSIDRWFHLFDDTKKTVTQSTGMRPESVAPMTEAACTVSNCCDERTSDLEARRVIERKLPKSSPAVKKEIHAHIARARAAQDPKKMDDIVLATTKIHDELKTAPRRK